MFTLDTKCDSHSINYEDRNIKIETLCIFGTHLPKIDVV